VRAADADSTVASLGGSEQTGAAAAATQRSAAPATGAVAGGGGTPPLAAHRQLGAWSGSPRHARPPWMCRRRND